MLILVHLSPFLSLTPRRLINFTIFETRNAPSFPSFCCLSLRPTLSPDIRYPTRPTRPTLRSLALIDLGTLGIIDSPSILSLERKFHTSNIVNRTPSSSTRRHDSVGRSSPEITAVVFWLPLDPFSCHILQTSNRQRIHHASYLQYLSAGRLPFRARTSRHGMAQLVSQC